MASLTYGFRLVLAKGLLIDLSAHWKTHWASLSVRSGIPFAIWGEIAVFIMLASCYRSVPFFFFLFFKILSAIVSESATTQGQANELFSSQNIGCVVLSGVKCQVYFWRRQNVVKCAECAARKDRLGVSGKGSDSFQKWISRFLSWKHVLPLCNIQNWLEKC